MERIFLILLPSPISAKRWLFGTDITGKSVYHAVVWQCRAGAAICKELKDKGYSELVQRKTGLLIDPYFSASGAKWILDNVENARELAEKAIVDGNY